MKPLVGSKAMKVWGLVMALGLPQAALAQELINRREQARPAFLATPSGIYGHYCAHCHGDDAKGGGRLWATELQPSPPDLTALAADKEYLLAVIRDGSGAQGKSNLCPPWGRTISPANQERLAQYIVSLISEASPPQPAIPTKPVTEPFPWLLLAVLLGEMVFLWRMLRPKKEVSNVVPQDSPMHG